MQLFCKKAKMLVRFAVCSFNLSGVCVADVVIHQTAISRSNNNYTILSGGELIRIC